MKTLFIFRGDGLSYEIIADDHESALAEIKRIMGDKLSNTPYLQLATQNYECPRCSCKATDCKL